jgi:hypothetical protein
MKTIRTQTIFASLAIAGFAALILSLGPGSASVAASERSGRLHIMKECTENTGGPGAFCTITYSNLAAIPKGSKIYYDQAGDTVPGVFDSEIVLDARNGNRAVGRCTLDGLTAVGICTISDGIGELAGFHARVDVTPTTDFAHYDWRGTYGFAEIGRQHGEHGD